MSNYENFIPTPSKGPDGLDGVVGSDGPDGDAYLSPPSATPPVGNTGPTGVIGMPGISGGEVYNGEIGAVELPPVEPPLATGSLVLSAQTASVLLVTAFQELIAYSFMRFKPDGSIDTNDDDPSHVIIFLGGGTIDRWFSSAPVTPGDYWFRVELVSEGYVQLPSSNKDGSMFGAYPSWTQMPNVGYLEIGNHAATTFDAGQALTTATVEISLGDSGPSIDAKTFSFRTYSRPLP